MTTWDHRPALKSLCARLLTTCFAKPERLKKSEWALKRRKMSAEGSSSGGGKFSFALAPWQREIIDCDDDPAVGKVVGMMASQVTGKTETCNNIIGATIALNPMPMLVVQPNEKPMAETWSKDRLAPMIRDTPDLRRLIRNPRSRDSGNTLLHKCFPGGHITCAGANSPASLASRPIGKLFLDEVDRFPFSAGTEGDPMMLAEKRTETFPDSVVYVFSTPTIKGLSRIEKEFEESDKRYWHCPCPKCGHWQILKWENVDFSTRGTINDPIYICAGQDGCGLDDNDRQAMVRAGEWRATAAFNGVRGYHISGIYCLFRPKRRFKNRLAQMVADFLSANAKGTETLKVWWNTFKAETWEDPAEKPPAAKELMERCENYLSKNDDGSVNVPDGVLCIVAGADTQSDRIELEAVGYGFGEESWGLGTIIVPGNPELPETWERVENALHTKFRHPSGITLEIAAALFDRGGTNQKSPKHAKSVDAFTRPRNSRRIYSCYGSTTPGQPIVAAIKPMQQGPAKTRCVRVGTDTAKGNLYSRLKLQRAGPRYMHFPEGFGYDLEFFEQLVSEREQTTWEEGRPTRKWVKSRVRNEALDKRVYATAALEILRPNFDAIAKNLPAKEPAKEYVLKEPKTETATTSEVKPTGQVSGQTRRLPRRQSSGFVGGWRK
jgi:phage terminase large subunit GpA-like protein